MDRALLAFPAGNEEKSAGSMLLQAIQNVAARRNDGGGAGRDQNRRISPISATRTRVSAAPIACTKAEGSGAITGKVP